MKKSLFGYNIKKTDELVSALQNQNDIMTTKLSTLTEKLTDATTELEAAKAEIERLTERLTLTNTSDQRIDELKARIEKLEKEKIDAKNEAEQKLAAAEEKIKVLSEQLNAEKQREDTSPAENSSLQRLVGSICERAYIDMERMRQNTIEEMEKQLATYSGIIEEYADRMQSSISDIKSEHGGIVNDISKSLSSIFDNLKTIESATQKLESNIYPMKNLSKEMTTKLKAVIDSTEGDCCPINPLKTMATSKNPFQSSDGNILYSDPSIKTDAEKSDKSTIDKIRIKIDNILNNKS
ncbi:MAG: hypothetical protein GX303_06565 [Clostridiales bacterium]|nr:hypothetical protein [Clostridiales bacterium]